MPLAVPAIEVFFSQHAHKEAEKVEDALNRLQSILQQHVCEFRMAESRTYPHTRGGIGDPALKTKGSIKIWYSHKDLAARPGDEHHLTKGTVGVVEVLNRAAVPAEVKTPRAQW